MGEAAVIYISDTLVDMGPCCVCGVRVGGPRDYKAQRLKDHNLFHCVNGHAQYFAGETEEEKLRKRLEAAELAARRAETFRREEAERLGRQVAAARGQVTKIKNRVGNGVCPCCNRTFQNLMRHMSTQHPDFKHDNEKTT